MARAARKMSSSGYYHVIIRGNNKQIIFHDDQDRKVFLNRFKIAKEKLDFSLVVFCLMSNHVHLIIKEGKDKIGKIIRDILSSYVYWYNTKYERIGNLFQDRFKSEPLESDDDLINCARYILRNPVSAYMLENFWEYKWSSANLLINNIKSFIDDNIIRELLDNDIVGFFEQNDNKLFIGDESMCKKNDEKALHDLLNILGFESEDAFKKLSEQEKVALVKDILKDNMFNLKQLERISGISYGKLRYYKNTNKN